MNETIVITPFESQVLQAMAQVTKNVSGGMDTTLYAGFFHPTLLSNAGTELFGQGWEAYWESYTLSTGISATRSRVVNMTLGRLAKKGLVEREDNEWEQIEGYTAGAWRLTTMGRQLTGIQAEAT